MSKITDGFLMGNQALDELKKIRKGIAIKNLIELAKMRNGVKSSTINGIELSDEDLYSMIEDLWDVTITDAQ